MVCATYNSTKVGMALLWHGHAIENKNAPFKWISPHCSICAVFGKKSSSKYFMLRNSVPMAVAVI